MPLTSGTRLGPYEILSLIGKGGMGEVYKAKDTRLDRTVAIKVLPEHFAESPERKARFEREAKAISQLNHPHICTLYDVGEQDGIDYLVMEYIEGETLAERLKKGPLPIDKALEYGIQIADGLDKAHGAGIVHRDLKPGNAMLTKSGVKLLDFGLAGRVHNRSGDSDESSPTEARPLTEEGAVLGTFQYMSPEQLEGKEADPRADIFAFGALLYEMVSGRKAFEGKSQASLISSIMTSEPSPLSTLRHAPPPALDHVIRKCLVKDADDRAASARGLMLDLQWIAAGGAESPVEAIPALPRASLFTALALGVLVGAGAVGLAVWSLGGDASVGPTRLSIRIPDDHRLDFNKELAFSPDGRDLVYVAAEDGVRRLYRRSLSAQAPVPLSGTEGARAPFFSPDGEWIGFFDGTALKRVALDGGQSVTVTAILADMPSGASWGVDDTILFSVFGGQGIVKVPAGGGEPEILVEGAVRPDHVPGSDAVLFERDHQILVRAMRTGEERVLIEGDGPRYVAGGHIAFYREGSLWAVPFDAKRLRLAGPAVELRADLYQRESQASLAYEVSRGGYLAFTPPGTDNVTQLVWLDREGEETEAFRQTGSFLNPELSPDGARVAVAKLDPESENRDIWIIDFRRNLSSRFTFDPASDFSSVWSPGGGADRVQLAPQRCFQSSHEAGDRHRGCGAAPRSRDAQRSPRLDFGRTLPHLSHLPRWKPGCGRDTDARRWGSPSFFWARSSRSIKPSCLPMTGGLPTFPLSPEETRFTFKPSRTEQVNGRSPPLEGFPRDGPRAAASFFRRSGLEASGRSRAR